MTNRRTVLQGFAGGVMGLAIPAAIKAAGQVVVTPVTPDLAMLSGAGGNVVVLSTNDGSVLVDSGAAQFGADLRATLGELFDDARVAALFNTHWHRDQVGSNEAIGGNGATIFAHEKTRQRLTTGYYLPAEDRYEEPLSGAGRPKETFYTQGTTAIGGRRIEYGYMIEAHTDGDIYVAFPDSNVIAVGDVLAPVRDPVFDWFGGGWLGGRVDSLAALLEISDQDTRFIPSYGPVLGRAAVQAEHEMFLVLFERMVEHVRLGESADDMLAAGVAANLGRDFDDPYKLLYDLHKGFWAHHNKLMPDIV